jgi:hypothetical protein
MHRVNSQLLEFFLGDTNPPHIHITVGDWKRVGSEPGQSRLDVATYELRRDALGICISWSGNGGSAGAIRK